MTTPSAQGKYKRAPTRWTYTETMNQASESPNAERLRTNGFCVVPNVLDGEMLQRLRAWSEARLSLESHEHFEQFRHHGSMISLDFRDPVAHDLITWPTTVSAMRGFGFSDPKWLSGYLISKPPLSPALWWHQDWWAWDEPESFYVPPPQLFAMYYLRDVDEHDGCLRVIPGSHLRPHHLHGELPPAHGVELNDGEAARRALGRQPDEISVAVQAGDVVFGDVRLLHATHPNRSQQRRTCLTIWYLPTYNDLSRRLRAYLAQHPSQPTDEAWATGEVSPSLAALLGRYTGEDEPAEYNRTPPKSWSVLKPAA